MNDYFKKYNIKPISYNKIGNCFLVNTNDNKRLIVKNSSNRDSYLYLKSKGFNNIVDYYDYDIDIYDYVDDSSNNIFDLVKIISDMHNKTSFSINFNINDFYNDIINRINDIRMYYSNINDYLDSVLFLNCCEYLLITNISIIYKSLDFSKMLLDKWFDKYKNSDSINKCFIHGNIDMSHLVGDKVISFDKSRFDYFYYDLINIIYNYFNYGINDIIECYMAINNIDSILYDLFIINLLIPKRLNLDSNLDNLNYIDYNIDYIYTVYEYCKSHDK